MANAARLKAILLNTQLQQKDNPLYQFLNSLIDAVNTIQAGTSGGGGGGGTTIINDNTYQFLNPNDSGNGGDSDSGRLIPGPQGISGIDGKSIPGRDGSDGEDGYSIPGPAGSAGATGATGAAGSNGNPGMDGNDGQDGFSIPGKDGLNGNDGISIRGFDGDDGDSPLIIPGPKGDKGDSGFIVINRDNGDNDDTSHLMGIPNPIPQSQVELSTGAIPFGVNGRLGEDTALLFFDSSLLRMTIRQPIGSIHGAGALNVWNTGSPIFCARVNDTTNSNQLTARKGRGTIAAPTKVLNGDGVGGFASAGYEEVTPSFRQNGTIQFSAAEDFTDIALGTKLRFDLCPIGSNVTSNMLLADFVGGFAIQTFIDISAAAAGRIIFPATQVPSTNANTLDDYEEGTFVPADASGAALAFTVNGTATYIKIGQLVVIALDITYPATANGSNSLIGALPFTILNSTNVGAAVGFTTVATGMNGNGVLNTTTIEPRNPASGTRYTNAQLSGIRMVMSMSYRATA